MSHFVLVHGSGQNSRSWARVGSLLTVHGHRVTAVELPKRTPGLSLEDHAEIIDVAIDGTRAVLVAHSLSGIFLPVVPSADSCALLVFVAAVVPEPGKSVRQQFQEDSSMFSLDWIAAGPRWFDPSQVESLTREFLLHDCDEETIAWGLQTADLLDTEELVTQKTPITAWPAVASRAIVATGDRTLSPTWCHTASERILGRPALEIESGHCPHMSRPRELTSVLERLAEEAGA